MCCKCCMILRSVLKHEILDYPLSENELRCLHVTKRQDDTCPTSLTPLGNQHMEYTQQFKKKRCDSYAGITSARWFLTINVTLPKTPLWTCHKDRAGTHSRLEMPNTHQEAMKGFLAHIMRLSGKSRQPPDRPTMAWESEEGASLGVLPQMGEVRYSITWGLQGPQQIKRKSSRLSHHMAEMWSRRGRGWHEAEKLSAVKHQKTKSDSFLQTLWGRSHLRRRGNWDSVCLDHLSQQV